MTQYPKKNFFKETLKRHSLLFVFIGLSFTPRLFSQSLFHKSIGQPHAASTTATEMPTVTSAAEPIPEATAIARVSPAAPVRVDQPRTAPIERPKATPSEAAAQITPSSAVPVTSPLKKQTQPLEKMVPKEATEKTVVKEISRPEETPAAKDSTEATIIAVRPVSDVPFPNETPAVSVKADKSDSLNSTPATSH